MFSTPILTAAALFFAAAALAFYLGLDLSRFLARMPTLTSISGVVAFKRAVAVQMYGSLAVLLLAVGAVCTATAGFYLEVSRWSESPALIVAVATFLVIELWARLLRFRAKRIPAGDDEISRQRDVVVEVWRSRPLPTWTTHWG